MNGRIRVVAGLVTTVVMVFSLAETIWAATCLPTNGPASVVVAADEAVPNCDGCRPVPRDEQGDHERPCPFGPAASSQSCVSAASLPASTTADFGMPVEAYARASASDVEPELLLAATLFRPPKS